MKKSIIFYTIFLCILGFAYAQNTETAEIPEADETDEITVTDATDVQDRNIRNWKKFPYALGAGAEFGLNSRDKFSLGYSAIIDRFLYNPHTALVLRGTMYDDFDTITITEAEIALRLYILEKWSGVFYTQLGFGAAFYREEERQVNTYIMNFVAGYRFYFQNGILNGFYIEPAVRVGYPFEWGICIFAGHWFSF